MTAEEIGRRAPLWIAMSDLFLDTEITEATLNHVARTIDASGFSSREAKAILFSEVAPAFCWNLLSPAGEWAGWSETAVRAMVLNGLDAGVVRRSIAACSVLLVRRTLAADWQRIADRLRPAGMPG